MSITLKVVTLNGSPYSQDLSAQFGLEGGTIGRRSDNTLVLPDPDSVISRCHGKISHFNGNYVYEDVSVAGTYICSQDKLLEHGFYTLQDGDRLRIGEYELAVSIVAANVAVAPDIFAEFSSFPAPETSRSDAWPEIDIRRDPFGNANALDTPPAAQDFHSSFLGQNDVSDFHQSFVPPNVESSVPDFGDLDLEGLLSGLDQPASSSSFGESAATTEDQLSMGLPAWPEVSSSNLEQPHSSKPVDEWATKDLFMPGDGPILGNDQLVRTGADINAISPNQPVAPATSVSSVPAVGYQNGSGRIPEAPQITPASPQSSEVFTRFLQGAGLTGDVFIPLDQQSQCMEVVGQIFRDIVDGMIVLLRARAELKSQARVAMTTMKAVNNNPLKFSVSAEDAMRLLLNPAERGFLAPVEAVKEAVSDVINHQIAIQAGIQASLTNKLKQFSPENFEKAFDEGIVFQKKQKCWEAYCKAYGKMVNDTVDGLFDDDFVEAYERQMMLLISSRKK
jgi:type VI secretion system FHA domain protein